MNVNLLKTTFLVLLIVTLVTAGTNKEGLRFLEKKKKEKGVHALPSGVLYKELKPPSGNASPDINTMCSVYFTKRLINGTEVDGSNHLGTPYHLVPRSVIKGWAEALTNMKEGAKWEVYIPSEFAYGDEGYKDRKAGEIIPGGAVLVLDVELVQVKHSVTEL